MGNKHVYPRVLNMVTGWWVVNRMLLEISIRRGVSSNHCTGGEWRGSGWTPYMVWKWRTTKLPVVQRSHDCDWATSAHPIKTIYIKM